MGVVRRQVDAGVDIVNDGESGKVGYSTYVTGRLSGFGGRGAWGRCRTSCEYPEWARMTGFDDVSELVVTPACTGDVAYADRAPLRADIGNLRAAADAAHPTTCS